MPGTACCPVDLQEGLERAGGDREFYRELLEMMMDEVPAQIGTIREGVGCGDAEAVVRVAHALKGAAANLAAHPVLDAARELEMAARDGRIDSLAPLSETLSSRLDELGQFLSSFS